MIPILIGWRLNANVHSVKFKSHTFLCIFLGICNKLTQNFMWKKTYLTKWEKVRNKEMEMVYRKIRVDTHTPEMQRCDRAVRKQKRTTLKGSHLRQSACSSRWRASPPNLSTCLGRATPPPDYRGKRCPRCHRLWKSKGRHPSQQPRLPTGTKPPRLFLSLCPAQDWQPAEIYSTMADDFSEKL